MSKGSRPRPVDRKKFEEGWEAIDWRPPSPLDYLEDGMLVAEIDSEPEYPRWRPMRESTATVIDGLRHWWPEHFPEEQP